MIRSLLLILLRFYKNFISPINYSMFGHVCIYKVSCSEYAMKMIEEQGVLKGGKLSIRRILSCNSIFSKD